MRPRTRSRAGSSLKDPKRHLRRVGFKTPEADSPEVLDIDLWHRKITAPRKGRKTRTVKISHDAARALDRYLRVRARHAQAYRSQLWLGVNNWAR